MRPETISMKRDIFGIDDGDDCCVEVEAKVIYGTDGDGNTPADILNQFIIFSKVFDKQRKLYPNDIRKAVQETIRICRELDVLNDYLAEEEAATVMYAFADQEREFSKALRKERSEGARSQMEEDAKGMYAEGIKPDVIARIQKTSVDVIEGILGLQRV